MNSTKGKIGTGKSFFNEAFGADEDGFRKILYMPETFIIYRMKFKESGWTDCWWNDYNNLTIEEKEIANRVIHSNKFDKIDEYKNLPNIYRVLVCAFTIAFPKPFGFLTITCAIFAIIFPINIIIFPFINSVIPENRFPLCIYIKTN